jgi:1,2-phenylacetyl-CoA epoxidase PaaB subunit
VTADRPGDGFFEVFARRQRTDPLRHIGCVEAPSVDLARVYARTTYDEEDWIEMWIVDREAMVPVLQLRS